MAQTAAPAKPTPAPTFQPAEIEALVAPIALYPDSLLSQVLMASTYPLEVVHAARWMQANRNLKGEAAVKAVQSQPWDPSVKSLVAFPQVLDPMNDKLEWTQKLGDAFLAQQKDVLDAVQRMRAKARANGKLESTEQQKVIVESETVVRIEPADPQVIYVPTYDPNIVYGTWAYPSYPPYYWPPYGYYYPYYPGGAFASGIAWGIGFAMAGAIFGDCNWGGGEVNIDIDRVTHFDRNFDRSKVNNGRWQHDVSHRQGVAYRDNATRERFAKNTAGVADREAFRGRDDTGGLDRGRVQGTDRPAAADRAGAAGDRNVAAPRDNAFQGVGNGAASQRDFDRGRSSAAPSRMSGGGGGGGMRMGGGRGGGRR
nr:DUF3300 domain-containing protein [Piscinibacter gummiphilus]